MVAGIIERSPVTNGLRDLLRGALGVNNKVDVGEAPRDIELDGQGKLIHPYAVINAWPSLVVYGSLELPESGARLTYQVTSVGRTDESAQVLADRIRRVVLERLANGSFRYSLIAGGSMTVTDRSQRELGLLTAAGGLWNVHDLFDLEVQAHV
jgi:hypothetical protein